MISVSCYDWNRKRWMSSKKNQLSSGLLWNLSHSPSLSLSISLFLSLLIFSALIFALHAFLDSFRSSIAIKNVEHVQQFCLDNTSSRRLRFSLFVVFSEKTKIIFILSVHIHEFSCLLYELIQKRICKNCTKRMLQFSLPKFLFALKLSACRRRITIKIRNFPPRARINQSRTLRDVFLDDTGNERGERKGERERCSKHCSKLMQLDVTFQFVGFQAGEMNIFDPRCR